MSYKALYRTHRPTSFDEVVGQNHITATLKNIILKDRVSHAYLFAGPRGTGKTSVAHLFAKTLNCSDRQDPTTTCGICKQCKAVNSMDIVEIDAASNNGVSDIRNLIENSEYAPSISKYKIYIIDEVHMLSKSAFNALLKTLEEPPKHVVFILATTEPHKIPVTILSRTQRYNFRRIKNEVIQKQLISILEKEKITFDKESIKMIAKLANGGMRDALSIADQASAFSNGSISFEAISQVFGIISTQNQVKLLKLAFEKKTKELLLLASEFIDNGGDIERVTSSLIDVLKDFIVFNKTSDKDLLSTLSPEEAQSFGITNTFAYGAVEELMKLLSDLRLSEVPRQAYELTLLKMTEIGETSSKKINASKTKTNNANNALSKAEEDTKAIKQALDIFSTKELTQKDDDVFTEEKLEALQETIEKTDAFGIHQQIVDEEEDIIESNDVENEILATREIPVNEIPSSETTQEIDVVELFSLEGEDLNAPAPVIKDIEYTIKEIINLLVQADRKILSEVKQAWGSTLSFSSNPKYGTFANLLEAAKIIAVGDGFVLISANESLVVSQINSYRKDPKFIEFINILLGRPMLLFAITKEQFALVKSEWRKLAEMGTLPKPKRIERVVVEKKEMNEAEGFGSQIFGELFDS